jgi:anti-anti-sigma factor
MAGLTLIEANDTFTHVALQGRLDLEGVEKLDFELSRQIVARRKPAILDISDVDVLASVGVGMLVRIARSMQGQGLVLVVIATGFAEEVLKQLKIDEVFPLVETYEQAREMLRL